MIRGGFWGGAWGLSWGGAWGEAWLLLNQPYQELSLKGQIFVRSYLTSIHSVEVVERIVSVAALNNISVIDAEVVVTAKHTVSPVEAIRRTKKTRVEQPSSGVPAEATPHQIADTKQKDIAVLHRVPALSIFHNGPDEVVVTRKSTSS